MAILRNLDRILKESQESDTRTEAKRSPAASYLSSLSSSLSSSSSPSFSRAAFQYLKINTKRGEMETYQCFPSSSFPSLSAIAFAS